MFCNQRLEMRDQRGFIRKMLAHAAGAANCLTQFPCTQYTVDARGFRSNTYLYVTCFAFRAKLCHIAHHQHAVARHFGQHLYRCGHRTNVSVVGVVQQQLIFCELNREQTPRYRLQILQARFDRLRRRAYRHRERSRRQGVGNVVTTRQRQQNINASGWRAQRKLRTVRGHVNVSRRKIAVGRIRGEAPDFAIANDALPVQPVVVISVHDGDAIR